MLGLNTQVFILVFGVTFVALGLAAWSGLWKNWYWRSRGTVYGYVPLGLLFVLYAGNPWAQGRPGPYYRLYQGLFVLLALCGVWWSLRPPAFVKPAWVRWLEAYPADVRQLATKAVEQGAAWEPHVASQDKLDAWVKSLRKDKRKAKGGS
jgi:hypothetical protein